MLHLTEQARIILESRYLRSVLNTGMKESPEAMFRRVAKAVASAEKKYGSAAEAMIQEENFYHLLSSLFFLPNSPTLMNAGIEGGQLSACYVLPVEDHLDGIFKTLHQAAKIQQSGGGTGFNFSALRPAHDPVQTCEGLAAGPLGFIAIFNSATEQIKQGGKRRGANMGIININHPDIEAFIDSKKLSGAFRNFNFSVGITDDFMQALQRDASWDLRHPTTHVITKTIPAGKLWKQIIDAAWQSGDPGLIFLDTINRYQPTPGLGRIEATNPCGELPLMPHESCNLGSVNLSLMLNRQAKGFEVNWELLKTIVHSAVRFLDNVIDVNAYLFEEHQAMAYANRKIGLGVMRWADMLVRLDIPYASEEAVSLAKKLMQFIADEAKEASAILASMRGEFPNFQKSIYAGGVRLRHAVRTSIAPTGTISLIAGTSSGIEPLYALAYQRKEILDGRVLDFMHPLFSEKLMTHGLHNPGILEKVRHSGSCASLPELPEDLRNLFQTAQEIDPYWHLAHQLAFQQCTDAAVSKTINLPHEASRDDIDKIYRDAWQQEARGITVFRDGCKGTQVLYPGIRSEAGACARCIT